VCGVKRSFLAENCHRRSTVQVMFRQILCRKMQDSVTAIFFMIFFAFMSAGLVARVSLGKQNIVNVICVTA